VTRPLIGVSTYLESGARWGVWELEAALLPVGYPRLVQAAGGVAAMLPPDDPSYAAAAVARVDGLVIAGGPDVDPVHYGAERSPRCGPPTPERDAWELALIRAALDSGTPLLGICRGMQLLNVALGGTLVQHLPDVPGAGSHQEAPGVFAQREVRTEPGSALHRVLGPTAEVDCHHHQALDRIAAGLTASAWAEDGVLEAVEAADRRFCLAVQWHPEAGADRRLFDALVGAAGARIDGARTRTGQADGERAPGSRSSTSTAP